MSSAVGRRSFSLTDAASSLTVAGIVLYPSAAAGDDVPVAEGAFPVVVVSHGNGGSGMLYRTLGTYLARNGFIVALPDHPGNNRADNALQRTLPNLEYRPRHVRLVIDWLYGASPFAAHAVPDDVAIVGHSLGGYTALALAGGRPMSGAHEAPDGEPRAIDVTPDERVKAIVLLAPAANRYRAPGALDAVRVPILMIAAEHDEYTPALHGEIVAAGVPFPARLERRTAAGAGHFSFLDPYPASMRIPRFPPANDPPGFDRAAFLDEVGAEVLAFLQRVL